MALPDYAARKAFAEAYGWNLCGWPAYPVQGDTVLLSRWEDRDGNVVAEPPSIECTPPKPGTRQFVTTDGEPHETFLRLPYYASVAAWESLLFEHLVRRTVARESGAE